jgi:hypothetical protein
VPSSDWSWPGRLLARGSTWLHPGDAQRGVPGIVGTNEAEGVTIATMIRSTTKHRSGGTRPRTRHGRWIKGGANATMAIQCQPWPRRGPARGGAHAVARARL